MLATGLLWCRKQEQPWSCGAEVRREGSKGTCIHGQLEVDTSHLMSRKTRSHSLFHTHTLSLRNLVVTVLVTLTVAVTAVAVFVAMSLPWVLQALLWGHMVSIRSYSPIQCSSPYQQFRSVLPATHPAISFRESERLNYRIIYIPCTIKNKEPHCRPECF